MERAKATTRLPIGTEIPVMDDKTLATLIRLDEETLPSTRVPAGSTRKRALKLALIREFGVCFWCKIPVRDYGKIPELMHHPRDMATIDHLISKYHRKPHERVIKVLACDPCNSKRSEMECKLYGPKPPSK